MAPSAMDESFGLDDDRSTLSAMDEWSSQDEIDSSSRIIAELAAKGLLRRTEPDDLCGRCSHITVEALRSVYPWRHSSDARELAI